MTRSNTTSPLEVYGTDTEPGVHESGQSARAKARRLIVTWNKGRQKGRGTVVQCRGRVTCYAALLPTRTGQSLRIRDRRLQSTWPRASLNRKKAARRTLTICLVQAAWALPVQVCFCALLCPAA